MEVIDEKTIGLFDYDGFGDLTWKDALVAFPHAHKYHFCAIDILPTELLRRKIMFVPNYEILHHISVVASPRQARRIVTNYYPEYNSTILIKRKPTNLNLDDMLDTAVACYVINLEIQKEKVSSPQTAANYKR